MNAAKKKTAGTTERDESMMRGQAARSQRPPFHDVIVETSLQRLALSFRAKREICSRCHFERSEKSAVRAQMFRQETPSIAQVSDPPDTRVPERSNTHGFLNGRRWSVRTANQCHSTDRRFTHADHHVHARRVDGSRVWRRSANSAASERSEVSVGCRENGCHRGDLDDQRSAAHGKDQSRRRALEQSRNSSIADLFDADGKGSLRARRRRRGFSVRRRCHRRGPPCRSKAARTSNAGSNAIHGLKTFAIEEFAEPASIRGAPSNRGAPDAFVRGPRSVKLVKSAACFFGLRRSSHDLLRPVVKPLPLDGRNPQALRPFPCRRSRHRLGLVHARQEPVHRYDHEEVDRGRDQHKRDERIDELTDREGRRPNYKFQVGVIRLAYYKCDQWRKKRLGQLCDHSAKRGADHHAHRHIHNISTQDEFLKAVEHNLAPPKLKCGKCKSGGARGQASWRFWRKARLRTMY